MMTRPYRYKYTLLVDRSTPPVLGKIAGALGFVNEVPGRFAGHPSPAAMLEALRAEYEADPNQVIAGLSAALGRNGEPALD